MGRVFAYKFLVIDDAWILEIENLQRRVNQATKHPEPVIQMDAPWDQETDVFNCFNVIYDEDEGVFKMWYSVMYYAGELQDGPSKFAYATSKDGIHWDKPKLGLVEVNGTKENNYIIPEIGIYGSIIKDPSDIPQRRYKMLCIVGSKEMVWARFHIPLSLAYSADGIHWARPAHVNPVLRGVSDGPWGFTYDPDRRKYLLFSRRVPNLPRDISLYESYDLVNWEDKGRVIVGGDALDPPEMYNFYHMMPFRYEDFHLGALNAQYTSPISESYDSYNRSPDYPDTTLGHLEIQLAYSRDGRRWNRPDDRRAIVPWGPEGSPDYGAIYPANNPIVKDGETWIYYLAQNHLHSWWHIQEEWNHNKSSRHTACGMLAKMPEDHWVSLDAGNKEGFFVHKPWGPPHEVFVNADAEGGSIEVELVNPFGRTMSGFSRAECIPITANGKKQEVKWKNGRHPWDFAKDHRGGVLARFYLKNAKLYSYTFTLPDPDGKLAVDKANTRWCGIIKHKSDSWDRLSTEPAIGLPPHSGPGPEKGQEKPGEIVLDF